MWSSLAHRMTSKGPWVSLSPSLLARVCNGEGTFLSFSISLRSSFYLLFPHDFITLYPRPSILDFFPLLSPPPLSIPPFSGTSPHAPRAFVYRFGRVASVLLDNMYFFFFFFFFFLPHSLFSVRLFLLHFCLHMIFILLGPHSRPSFLGTVAIVTSQLSSSGRRRSHFYLIDISSFFAVNYRIKNIKLSTLDANVVSLRRGKS